MRVFLIKINKMQFFINNYYLYIQIKYFNRILKIKNQIIKGAVEKPLIKRGADSTAFFDIFRFLNILKYV